MDVRPWWRRLLHTLVLHAAITDSWGDPVPGLRRPCRAPSRPMSPVLAAHLAEHGVPVRFSTEVRTLDIGTDGAVARLHDLTSGRACRRSTCSTGG